MTGRIFSADKVRRSSKVSLYNGEEPFSCCSTPATSASTTRRQRRALWGTVGLFLVNTVALLIYHAHTTAALESDAKTTKDGGLAASLEFPVISAVDKILFSVLVLMAFELLDFLTKNSGSKLLVK